MLDLLFVFAFLQQLLQFCTQILLYNIFYVLERICKIYIFLFTQVDFSKNSCFVQRLANRPIITFLLWISFLFKFAGFFIFYKMYEIVIALIDNTQVLFEADHYIFQRFLHIFLETIIRSDKICKFIMLFSISASPNFTFA